MNIRKYHSTRRTIGWCLATLIWLLAVHDLSSFARQAGRESAHSAMEQQVPPACSYATREALKKRIREAWRDDRDPEPEPDLATDIERCGIKAALHQHGRVHPVLEFEGQLWVSVPHGGLQRLPVQLWSSLPVYPCRHGGKHWTVLYSETGQLISDDRYMVPKHPMILGCDGHALPITVFLYKVFWRQR